MELKLGSEVIMKCQFPVISTLDKILVHHWAQEKGVKKKPLLDKIMKLFPSNVEVRLISQDKSSCMTIFNKIFEIQIRFS